MTVDSQRYRFPGITNEWSRFDGPAGTQVVDSAIEAMQSWQTAGSNANNGGAFLMAHQCDELMDTARSVMSQLLGTSSASIVIGPSATAMIMRVALAAAVDLTEGDEIICTQADHDANVSPWLLAARASGATVKMAKLDPVTGELPVDAVTQLVGPRTRWVAVTGASNVLGTVPDVAAITAAAHSVGAKVVVDGVHLIPHLPVDLGQIGCDVFVTSAYKWYAPHGTAMYIEPGLLESLAVNKIRPAPDTGPGRFELGTAHFASVAGMTASARYLLELGMNEVAAHENALFAGLSKGLASMDGVTLYGPHLHQPRTPTAFFTVAGTEPRAVAEALAAERIAVWSGHNYGLGAVESVGLTESGGGVRAGVSIYTSVEDVNRLLAAVAEVAYRGGR